MGDQEAETLFAVIYGAVRVTPYPEWPGTEELGNCCCHETTEGGAVWGDGEWGGNP